MQLVASVCPSIHRKISISEMSFVFWGQIYSSGQSRKGQSGVYQTFYFCFMIINKCIFDEMNERLPYIYSLF